MNIITSGIFVNLLMIFVLASDSFAQDNLLSRVPQLEETARKASGGVLGCGNGGSRQLITSKGETSEQAFIQLLLPKP